MDKCVQLIDRYLCRTFGSEPHLCQHSDDSGSTSPASWIHSKPISVRRKQTAASFKWSLSEMPRQLLFARIPSFSAPRHFR